MPDQLFCSLFGFTKDSGSLLSIPIALAPDAAVKSNNPSSVEGASSILVLSEPIIKDTVKLSPPSNQHVAVEVPVL